MSDTMTSIQEDGTLKNEREADTLTLIISTITFQL
jgi:hypothetical protein